MMQAMYGTRKASLLWPEHIKTTFEPHELLPAKGCGQLFRCEKQNVTVAPKAGSAWMDDVMSKSFETKRKYVIGPGEGDLGEYLHRSIIHWPGWGFGYQPDPKHIVQSAERLGLSEAKAAPTPAVRDKPTKSDSLDRLDKNEAELFASVTQSMTYLSVDRYEVMYLVPALAQELKEPTQRSMLMLRRLMKFLRCR